MLTDRLLKFRAAMRASAHLDIPIVKTKNAKSVEDVLDEHIATVTKALEKVKEGEKSTDERLGELRSEITELSQKMAQGQRGAVSMLGDPGATAWGRQFTDSERFKAYVDMEAQDRPREMRCAMKAIDSGASAGDLIVPQRDEVVSMPQRRLVVRDLLTIINTETGVVETPVQTERTNAAGVVAEGALKPESSYKWELKDTKIRTIAHWVEASRQIIDDVPQLEGLIDGELRYGLDLNEEAELIYGDGTGEHLTGLAVGATAYSAPFTVAGQTMIDQIGLALLQAALTDVEPDGIVIHPSDWLRLLLTKDAAGGYIIANPQGQNRATLFGQPVVPTKAMNIDKFLVGPFKRGAAYYDRMQTEVRISDQDRDNFVRNKLTIRAEKRIGLGKKRPASFIYGDFGNVA